MSTYTIGSDPGDDYASYALFRAAHTEAAGDTITFRKGDTFRESIVVPTTGTAGSLVTYSTHGTGAAPIINGSTVTTTWTLDSAAIYTKTLTVAPTVIVEDDTFLRWHVWNTNVATTFASATAGSWSNNGVIAYVWCTDSLDPDTHTMEVANKTGTDVYGFYLLNKSYITIDGLQIEKCTNRGIRILINSSGGTQSNNIVQNCVVRLNGDNGIDFDSQGNATADRGSTMNAYNNTVSYNRRHGIMLGYGTVDSLADHNTCHHNGWGGVSAATGGDGISSGGASATCNPRRNVYEYNTCYNQYVTTTGI